MLKYSRVSISSSTHFENAVNLMAFALRDTFQRVPSRVERDRFAMPASVVNAYYDPTLNSINFPAGIVQPPFFGVHYPREWNYGALGMVVGHEVCGTAHDAKGRRHTCMTCSAASDIDL
jgi:predicted metalloendopeptidase